MFYYFDKTTHRCTFTCSMPIVYGDTIRIEAADGFNDYPLSALMLVDGMISVDESVAESLMLEQHRSETLKQIDFKLREIDGFEKYDAVDVSAAREALSLARHKTIKATTFKEIPDVPLVQNGLLVEEETQ